MIDTTIDCSMLPEIRGRLYDIEKPFVTFAGVRTSDSQPVFGVNLLAMKESLTEKQFGDYLECLRELRRLERLGMVAERRLERLGAAQ